MAKKLVMTALGAATLAFGSNAHAALVVNASAPAGTFTNNDVSCPSSTTPCPFADTITFSTPSGFTTVSATISSIASDALTNIDFTQVMINGVQFALQPNGTIEFGSLLSTALNPTTNVLTVMGRSNGAGSYSGTLTFGTTSGVPEPAAWLLMILGIGFAGGALRRRRTATPQLRYGFAR